MNKTKANKKPAKKKADAIDPFTLDDESEGELDSLGSFFLYLIDIDYYQDDAEASQADDVEVITLFFGSDSMPTQKNSPSNPENKLFSSSF